MIARLIGSLAQDNTFAEEIWWLGDTPPLPFSAFSHG
jgi:hypothetical protein